MDKINGAMVKIGWTLPVGGGGSLLLRRGQVLGKWWGHSVRGSN